MLESTMNHLSGKEIFIDLSKQKLLCFQNYVYKGVVSKMVGAILSGKRLPPVRVVQLSSNNYSLTTFPDTKNGGIDGGHHRAYSHFITGTKLNCFLVNPKYRAFHNPELTIKDLKFKRENSLLDLSDFFD